MARPSSTRLDGGPGFAPETSGQVGLGVYAPLNVTAEQSQATALAQALGVLGDVAVPELRQHAYEEGKNAAIDGQNDARLGRVDEGRRKQNENYAKGAVSVEADQQALAFINEYEAHYADEVDKDASMEEVAQDFDARAKVALEHWLDDRQSASIVSKKLQAYISRKTYDHNQQQIARREERAVENAYASVGFDLTATGTVDFNAQALKVGPIVEQGKANDVVLDAIGKWAITNARPDVLDDAIPKEITRADGQKVPILNNPAVAAKVAEYRSAAQLAFDRKHAIEKETRLANLTKSWQDTVDSGVRLGWQKQILPHVMNGDMSREEALSWYSKSINQKLEKQTLSNDMQLLAAGGRWQLKTGDLDASGDEYTQDRFQKAFDALVQSAPEDQQLSVAVRLSQTHSLPATKFKTQLNQIVATDEALESNLKLYTSLSTLSPDLMHLYVDRDKRGQYEAMLRMQRSGMGAAQIREAIKDRDPEFARDQWDRFGRDVTKAVEKASLPTPGVFGTSFFGGTAVSQVGNGDYIRKRIQDQARVMVESGVQDDPQALVAQAAKQVYDSHVAVDLGTGRKVLIERWEGAPNDLSDFVDFTRTKWLEGNEKALGIDPEDGPVTLAVSQNADNARRIEFRQNGYRIGKSVPFEAVYGEYTKAVKADLWGQREAHARRAAENAAEAVRLRKAADEGYAQIPHGSPKLKY